MSDILLLLCSPRHNGVTDNLARYYAAGAASNGAKVNRVALRDYKIIPCCGCGSCSLPPYVCIYSQKDDLHFLFSLLHRSSLIFCASPIYFYALPSHFKAFIDRGQQLWARAGENCDILPLRSAIVILNAGRPRGEKLFAGSLLTLSYFFKTMNVKIARDIGIRGIETPAAITAGIKKQLFAIGWNWRAYVPG